MIVEPRVRGFICTTAHPQGCAANVGAQIAYVKSQAKISGAKKALIIGGSTGYGLATRISAAFGCGAATLCVAFERPAVRVRTATAGWYNTVAFEREAKKEGLYARTVIADAFSGKTKQDIVRMIREDLGKVDLVVYSLAAPRRKTDEGKTYSSVLKPIGSEFRNKTIDMNTRQVTDVTVDPATEEEIEGTVKVMGGEDWMDWMKTLKESDVLEEGATALAYSYIGPKITHPVYRDGTVGVAKKDLERTAGEISKMLRNIGGKAYVSVNKAVVTQASSAIPVVPLYISILFKIMKEKGLHEGCIEQMYRLLAKKLYAQAPMLDGEGRLRMDDLELREDVQAQVNEAWDKINNDNLKQYADLDGYWAEFYRLFGFGIESVDYAADVQTDIAIPSME